MRFFRKHVDALIWSAFTAMVALVIWSVAVEPFVSMSPKGEVAVSAILLIVVFSLSFWRLKRVWVDKHDKTKNPS